MTVTQRQLREQIQHWRYIVVVLLLALVTVIIVRRRGGVEEAEVAPLVAADVATAQVKTFTVTLSALGTVEPRPGFSAQIAAPEATRVQRVYVAVGDRVSAGQALVQLDVSVWDAKLRQAEVGLTTAQQAYNRAERLLTEGIAPRKDVETAAADLATARAGVEEARRLARLGTIRSPVSGVVTALNVVLAQNVDAGAPIVEVVDPRGLEITFHLSPTEAGQIRPGADVELASGQEPQRVIIGHGVIKGVSAAVDSTGSVAVRASIAAPNRPLKVGEVLSGRIVVTEHRNAIVVPISALVPSDDQTQVFVVDKDSIAHATNVTVRTRSETEAEIASGLKGGETVITRGAYGVTDSAKVQIGPAK